MTRRTSVVPDTGRVRSARLDTAASVARPGEIELPSPRHGRVGVALKLERPYVASWRPPLTDVNTSSEHLSHQGAHRRLNVMAAKRGYARGETRRAVKRVAE